MTDLILVRHGQSEGNEKRLFLGHTDLDLTPLGREQAKRAGAYLAGERIDAVYSSDLIRAYHTAEPIAAAHGLTPIRDAELREIFAGEWEGLDNATLRARYQRQYWLFRHDIGLSEPEGGETTAAVGVRILHALERIAAAHPDGRVAVVTHATSICMGTAAALGLPRESAKRIALPPNASVSVLRYCEGYFSLMSYAEHAYLGDVYRPRLLEV